MQGSRPGLTTDERAKLKELEQAIWARSPRRSEAPPARPPLRPVESGQYLSIRYTEHLAETTAVNSVGSKADSYDNALAETTNGP